MDSSEIHAVASSTRSGHACSGSGSKKGGAGAEVAAGWGDLDAGVNDCAVLYICMDTRRKSWSEVRLVKCRNRR